MAREAADVAFSPDGKLLATAHSYNADPGEVKLWDMTTGAQVATLPVADRGVVSVVFSPDGKILAGRVYRAGRSPVIMGDRPLGRRLPPRAAEVRRPRRADLGPGLLARRHGPRHQRGGSGRAVLGRGERARDRRIDGRGSGRALAFSPDGQTLVMTGAGRPSRLWDVAGNRLRAAR